MWWKVEKNFCRRRECEVVRIFINNADFMLRSTLRHFSNDFAFSSVTAANAACGISSVSLEALKASSSIIRIMVVQASESNFTLNCIPLKPLQTVWQQMQFPKNSRWRFSKFSARFYPEMNGMEGRAERDYMWIMQHHSSFLGGLIQFSVQLTKCSKRGKMSERERDPHRMKNQNLCKQRAN